MGLTIGQSGFPVWWSQACRDISNHRCSQEPCGPRAGMRGTENAFTVTAMPDHPPSWGSQCLHSPGRGRNVPDRCMANEGGASISHGSYPVCLELRGAGGVLFDGDSLCNPRTLPSDICGHAG